MLNPKCFIVGMFLALSLKVKGVVYCPTVPAGAIIRRQQLDKERREQEQMGQLNELIKQGKTVVIMVGNMELRIKQRKMIDTTVDKNKKLSLKMCLFEAVCFAVFLCTVGVSPLLFTYFFIRPLFEQETKTKKL